MQIPEGTPESQVKLIRDEGRRVVREEFGNIMREAGNDFVENE